MQSCVGFFVLASVSSPESAIIGLLQYWHYLAQRLRSGRSSEVAVLYKFVLLLLSLLFLARNLHKLLIDELFLLIAHFFGKKSAKNCWNLFCSSPIFSATYCKNCWLFFTRNQQFQFFFTKRQTILPDLIKFDQEWEHWWWWWWWWWWWSWWWSWWWWRPKAVPAPHSCSRNRQDNLYHNYS